MKKMFKLGNCNVRIAGSCFLAVEKESEKEPEKVELGLVKFPQNM